MHPKPDKNAITRFWSRLVGSDYKKLVERTKIAAEAMLPRWNGFCLEKDAENRVAEEVLAEILDVHQCFRQHFLGEDCQNQDEKPFKEVSMILKSLSILLFCFIQVIQSNMQRVLENGQIYPQPPFIGQTVVVKS